VKDEEYMMCIHLSVENMNLFAIKNCCKICNVTLLATPAHGVQANGTGHCGLHFWW
jgi:hypothetical protein